jgi:SAM-dependent methyltransferase
MSRKQPSQAELARVLRRSLRDGSQALYRDGLFFDRFYRRRARDVAFYVATALRYGGGPVLELGVGTGRVARALATAGVEVTGVDVMQSMLRRARERLTSLPKNARARVTLVRGDMRRLSLGKRFPLVIAPFNAFTHLYDRRDLERALACCHLHLAARGRLVFDVVMPEMKALLQDPERLYRGRDVTDPQDGRRFTYYEASHYDCVRQIRSVTMVLERAGERGPGRAIPLTQRQFFPAELEALLYYNGFDLEQRYGDFALGPLTDRSETQVIVAKKRPTRARKR